MADGIIGIRMRDDGKRMGPPTMSEAGLFQKKKNPQPSETEILATASMRSTGPE